MDPTQSQPPSFDLPLNGVGAPTPVTASHITGPGTSPAGAQQMINPSGATDLYIGSPSDPFLAQSTLGQGTSPVTATLPMGMPSAMAPPMSASNPAAIQPEAQNQGVSPEVADDVDLIEKAWVEKAKEIVTKTRSDPHVQTTEMNRFKADYLKKRYNKDLKLGEDS